MQSIGSPPTKTEMLRYNKTIAISMSYKCILFIFVYLSAYIYYFNFLSYIIQNTSAFHILHT